MSDKKVTKAVSLPQSIVDALELKEKTEHRANFSNAVHAALAENLKKDGYLKESAQA